MAQLTLTAVGYYFGGPIGGAIGSAIGGAIDRSFAPDPADQVGPRLSDLKVTGSSYGGGIPRHFGTVRKAANIIWSTDLEEVETRTETEADTGGKGGGPTQTTITYSYFATFAMSFGVGPARGIRRLFANGVLVWDATVGASSPDAVALDFTFYRGEPDQLPDPTMEADLGVGMVPGYRDEALIVFHSMPLEKFGNRIPSIEAETTMEGDWAVSGQTLLNAAASTAYRLAAQTLDGSVIGINRVDGSNIELVKFDPITGQTLVSEPYAMALGIVDAVYVPPTNELWVAGGTGAGYVRFNADTLEQVGFTANVDGAYHPGGAFYDGTQRLVIGMSGISAFFGYYLVAYDLDGSVHSQGLGALASSDFLIGGGTIAGVGVLRSGRFTAYNIVADSLAQIVTQSDAGAFGAVFDPTRGRYVAVGSSVWTVDDSATATFTDVTPSGYAPGTVTGVKYLGGLDAIAVFYTVVSTLHVVVLDAETFDILLDSAVGSTVSGYTSVGVFDAQQQLPGTLFMLGATRPWVTDIFGTTYASAVQTLCLASGELVEADVDVSELTQRLNGYSVAQPGPARSAIEQLARADFFDGVEIDDQIKFPRRGGAVVATITTDDCGAGIDQAADRAITSTRQQEINLPAKLSITAPDPYTDHQPGTQDAERLAHQAGEEEGEQYAVVLTANQCKRLADARLFDRWVSREPGSISTTRKFARLTPADPVTLDGRRVRITSRSDEGGVIRFEWVTDDADVIDQVSTGAQGSFTPQTVSVQVPTELIVLDMALLRDGDDEPGAYVAAWGLAPYWRGMSLFSSSDAGASYAAEVTLGAPGSSVGEATTALGDWTGGNRFDEANSLTVRMINGAPSGTTRASVLAGNNGLAIEGPDGWEILQYRDATLNGDGTYTLGGFLRGRRGTEWATGGHDIGDRVVLLASSTMRSMTLEAAELGVSLLLKPVTVGDTLAGTDSQAETINGERLKPFSPVDLRALRDVATGDITLAWRRRTRKSYRFLAEGIAAPLGEDSEAYVVKIWADGTYTTLKRTISASSESAGYTSAQQVTDFGTNQSTVYVTVTQTSATVGAGHELQDAA